jgi:hypothetical protein
MKKAKRYLIIVLLIAVSAVPSMIMLPVMGNINLLFLLILWAVFLAVIKVLPKSFLVALSVLFAVAMTIPPYPNYLSVTNDGHFSLGFIGFENVFGGALWRLAFFFIFYLVFFIVAALLVGRQAQSGPHAELEKP